jgi:Undecaprenyl-phosphate glucose phosphotransferase
MSTMQDYGLRLRWPRMRRTQLARGAAVVLAGLADFATIVAVAILSGVGYHHFAHEGSGAVPDFAMVGVLAGWLFLLPRAYRGDYAASNYLDSRVHAGSILHLWNFAFVCLITLAFLTKVSGAYSRGWIVLFYAGGAVALIAVNAGLVRLARWGNRTGLLATRRVLLVGIEEEVRDFVRRYKPWTAGLDIVGVNYLSLPDGAKAADRDAALQRPLQTAVASARVLRPDSIVIVAPWSQQTLIARCIEAFMTVPASIHLGPERILDQFEHLHLEKFGRIASLHLLRPPLSAFEIATKRAFDIAVAAAGLIVLSPLFVVVAALIKLDSPGPALFRQTRYGFNQRPFGILKFRTMRTMENGSRVTQATKNDPRVTRVGRFLRRCNIDELPQLVNVLKGDMSIVGPRPHALVHDESWGRNITLYARRHNVKPGITGWAQVNGYRGEIDSDERLQGRIACDLYYIDNWSIGLDIKILVLTVFSRRAYTNAL